jgi:hypothetical protein
MLNNILLNQIILFIYQTYVLHPIKKLFNQINFYLHQFHHKNILNNLHFQKYHSSKNNFFILFVMFIILYQNFIIFINHDWFFKYLNFFLIHEIIINWVFFNFHPNFIINLFVNQFFVVTYRCLTSSSILFLLNASHFI